MKGLSIFFSGLWFSLFTILAFSLSKVSAEPNSKDPFFWKNRVLLYSVDKDSVEEKNEIIAFLEDGLKALDDRDLVVFVYLGKKLVWQRGNALSKKDSLVYWKSKGVTLPDQRTVLVGKDGGVKLREPSIVNLKKVFDLIDQMPMRIQEMKRKED